MERKLGSVLIGNMYLQVNLSHFSRVKGEEDIVRNTKREVFSSKGKQVAVASHTRTHVVNDKRINGETSYAVMVRNDSNLLGSPMISYSP
jgi:hypothetical protein